MLVLANAGRGMCDVSSEARAGVRLIAWDGSLRGDVLRAHLSAATKEAATNPIRLDWPLNTRAKCRRLLSPHQGEETAAPRCPTSS